MPRGRLADPMTNLDALADSSTKSARLVAGCDDPDLAVAHPADGSEQASNSPSATIRLLQTVRHLRPQQAFYWAIRRSLGRRYRVPTPADPETRSGVGMAAELRHSPTELGENEFEFLNVRRRYSGNIEWRDTSRAARASGTTICTISTTRLIPAAPEWIVSAMRDWTPETHPEKRRLGAVSGVPAHRQLDQVRLWRTP